MPLCSKCVLIVEYDSFYVFYAMIVHYFVQTMNEEILVMYIKNSSVSFFFYMIL